MRFDGAFGGNTDVSSFTNSGNISGGRTSVRFNSTFTGDFTNRGSISGNLSGVWFEEDFTGDFTNSGNITATYSAASVRFNELFTGRFTNSGNISGGYTSVRFNSTFDGDFTNSGNITATSPYSISGTSIVAGVLFDSKFDGNFTNSGNITSSNDEYGLHVALDFTGDLINTGNISGTSTADGTNYIYIGGDFKGNMTQPVGVRVDVGGTADLSNRTFSAHIELKDLESLFDPDFKWIAIEAKGAVNRGVENTDNWYTLTDNSFLVEFTDEESDGDTLIFTIANIGDVADAPVCDGLGLVQVADAVIDEAEIDFDTIPDEMLNLVGLLVTAGTAGEVAAIIEDYSPVSGGGHGVLGNSQQVTDQLAERLRPNSTNGLGAWGSVLGGTGDLDTCSGHATITAGAIGGFEGQVNEATKVGVALAYVHAGTDGKANSLGDEVNIHSLSPALYARYQPDGIDGVEGSGGLYAQGSVAGAYSFIDQTRAVMVTGERFEADYNALSVSGRAEIGYDAPLGHGQGYITPYAAAGFNLVALDGYSESGSGDDLDVSGFDGVFPVLEGGLRSVFVGEQAEFSVQAGYRHEFGKEDISASLGATSFDTTLNSVGSGFMTGLGLNVRSGDATTLGFSYDGLFGEDQVSHIGSVNFSFHM